jgi:hypothetical protein
VTHGLFFVVHLVCLQKNTNIFLCHPCPCEDRKPEAKNLKSDSIGTEHLLLGLLSIPKSLGFSILTGAGVTQENILILLKADKMNYEEEAMHDGTYVLSSRFVQ